MIRYIDPIWLYENVQEQVPQFAEMLKNLILVAPSIGICFCRECEYGEYRADFDDYECHVSGCGLVHEAEFYCADGKKRIMNKKKPCSLDSWVTTTVKKWKKR